MTSEISNYYPPRSPDINEETHEEIPEVISSVNLFVKYFVRNDPASTIPGRLFQTFIQVKDLEQFEPSIEVAQKIAVCLKNLGFVMDKFFKYRVAGINEEMVEHSLMEFFERDIFAKSTLSWSQVDLVDNEICHQIIGNYDKAGITLELENKSLFSLPRRFNLMTHLRVANFTNNLFNSIPYEIFSLTRLKELYFEKNPLNEIPKEIGRLSQLEILSLSGSNIDKLPNQICRLTKLQHLILNDNPITNIPKGIRNLVELRLLNIKNCKLTSLPIEMKQLQKLHYLYAKNNLITSISNELIPILKNCKLEGRLKLDNNVLTLEQKESLSNQIGHRYYGDRDDERNDVQHFTIEHLIKNIYEFYGKEPISFEMIYADPIDFEALNSWVYRLDDISKYEYDQNLRFWIADRVVNILERAEKDEFYRNVFALILEYAKNMPRNQVVLSLIGIELQYKLQLVSLNDPKTLSKNLINSVATIEHLEKTAEELFMTNSESAEVSIYLGLIFKLKERLNIPLDLSCDSTFLARFVSDEKVETIANNFIETYNNEDKIHEFLLSTNYWKMALESKLGDHLNLILNDEKRSLERGEDPLQVIAKKDAGLFALSKLFLNQETAIEDANNEGEVNQAVASENLVQSPSKRQKGDV